MRINPKEKNDCRAEPELCSQAVDERLAALGAVDITEGNRAEVRAESNDPQLLRKGALAGHQLLAALQREHESEVRNQGR